jgi:hypothetical protein
VRLSEESNMIEWLAARLPGKSRSVLPTESDARPHWWAPCIDSTGTQRSRAGVYYSDCPRPMVTREATTHHVAGALVAIALPLYALATSAYMASWQSAGPYFPTVKQAADTYYTLYGPHCADHHPTGWQSGWYGWPLQQNQVEYRVCNDQYQNKFSE